VILRLEASPEAIVAAEEEAEQLLSSVYNKFNEGFETSDLKTARADPRVPHVSSTFIAHSASR
jgi:hypothetical protein